MGEDQTFCFPHRGIIPSPVRLLHRSTREITTSFDETVELKKPGKESPFTSSTKVTFRTRSVNGTRPGLFSADTSWQTACLHHYRLRGFTTLHAQQAIYKRFADGNNKPTWPLMPTSSHQQHRKWRYDQSLYGLPSWIWFIGATGGVYYLVHLEKVEVTGRWRFMDTSIEAEIATKAKLHSSQKIYRFNRRASLHANPIPISFETATSKPSHDRFITGVAQKIIQASERPPTHRLDHSSHEFGDWAATPGSPISSNPGPVSDWKIHVIDEPKIQNAWEIFVFTGILPICKTEAGLATVLGHEVAHQVLRHPAERMSSMKVIFLLTTMLSIVGLDPAICRAAVTLLMTLPNSRRSEVEADQIGLNIMASACYDPKEAIGVWKRMDQHDQSSRITRTATEFLQTHPTHDTRIEKITSWLPEAQSHFDRKCGFTNKAFHQFNHWNS
ncbi:hypothetical protein H4Q26_003041 [Puccinia striiformis f. sp. tritici PST-130]|nr:hypothetical protein H4Q26_003041 [Puccinia striiformis f. sp. tritici PST-130]